MNRKDKQVFTQTVFVLAQMVLYTCVYRICRDAEWWDWIDQYPFFTFFADMIIPLLVCLVFLGLTIWVLQGKTVRWKEHKLLLASTVLLAIPRAGILCAFVIITVLIIIMAPRMDRYYGRKNHVV